MSRNTHPSAGPRAPTSPTGHHPPCRDHETPRSTTKSQIPWPWRQVPVAPLTLSIDAPRTDQSVGGSPAIIGKVTGLRPGHTVWSFNEPSGTGRAYPSIGPCKLNGDQYNCHLTQLSIDEANRTSGKRAFRLWVAVVDENMAARNAEVKAEYNGITPYFSITDDGPDHVGTAIRNVDVLCEAALQCPMSPAQGTPPPAQPASASIDAPRTDAALSAGTVLVSGRAQGLGADELWLFDRDPQSGYTRDTDVPLEIDNGKWTFDNEMEPGTVELTLVRANHACALAIRALRPDTDGTVYTPTLPSGCTVADRRIVTIK